MPVIFMAFPRWGAVLSVTEEMGELPLTFQLVVPFLKLVFSSRLKLLAFSVFSNWRSSNQTVPIQDLSMKPMRMRAVYHSSTPVEVTLSEQVHPALAPVLVLGSISTTTPRPLTLVPPVFT